ncbi:MAG: hypothetical protein ACOYNI_05305 [Acidimicrobiia bacterium]
MAESRAKILLWGATMRCPRCGSGKVIKRFALVKECPRCHLHFEREHGYWTGALAIHFILLGGLILISMAILIAVTVPGVPVVPLIAILLVECVVFGTLFYPLSRTMWVAVDRAYMQRLDDSESADEQYGN